MKHLISQKERHLLWKDEVGDDFILLKFCEIYRYDDSQLGVIFFSGTIPLEIKPLIYDFFPLGDGLYTCKTKAENLPRFIALGRWKKRPHVNGRLIKRLEKRLGHKILPYRPVHLKVVNNPVIKRYKNLMQREYST